MLSTIIALFAGLISGVLLYVTKTASTPTTVFLAVLTTVVVQVIISLTIRKKTRRINDEIQNIMLEGQNKINRQMQNFQRKPQSGVKAMQTLMEKEQAKFIRKAIEVLAKYQPFYKWNFLLKKQISTMKMMFYFQLRDFKKADELMKDSLFVDSRALAFKLVRMYKNGEDYETVLKKKLKKFKATNAVILYAFYSWVLVKEKRIDDAISILIEAFQRTGEDVFSVNHQMLVNGKEKKFSNAKLGDVWYALYLEEPQMAKQGKMRQKMNKRGF
ncbi:hypothetical protein AAEX28_08330 [Lentisphaerota bacterium WC36G]|nr:hypothetical protein LJT99_11185 [Lentisphaerae bacterium WC36]